MASVMATDVTLAMEKQSAMLAEVLQVLGSMQEMMSLIARSVASPSVAVTAQCHGPTSRSNWHKGDVCMVPSFGDQLAPIAQQPSARRGASLVERLEAFNAGQAVACNASDGEETTSESSSSSSVCRREYLNTSSAADQVCAFGALDTFGTDTTATITGTDFVATARALGLEKSFRNFTGEALTEDSIRPLFDVAEFDAASIPFFAFHQAMKELTQHRERTARAKTATPHLDVPTPPPTPTLDSGASIEAMSKSGCYEPRRVNSWSPGANIFEAERLDADAISQVSTMDQTSLAPTQSCRVVRRRTPSFYSTRSFDEVSEVVRELGGHFATVATRSKELGPLECILLEPIGKQLGHAGYGTTGLVIYLHGMPPSPPVLRELGRASCLAGWPDFGITVAIPNLQMSAALRLEDLEAIVEAVLEHVTFPSCLLVGKFWGAQRVVELAASDGLAGKVDGAILLSPSSPAPQVCSRLEIPVLLIWAEDDDSVTREEAMAWIKALDGRCAPSVLKQAESAGQRFDHLLEKASLATSVRYFTVSSLLVADATAASTDRNDAQREQRLTRLAKALPPGFAERCISSSCQDRPLREVLWKWMCAGLPTASE
jgi:dienelactone hydrolase